jgi:hypothetical protein
MRVLEFKDTAILYHSYHLLCTEVVSPERVNQRISLFVEPLMRARGASGKCVGCNERKGNGSIKIRNHCIG